MGLTSLKVKVFLCFVTLMFFFSSCTEKPVVIKKESLGTIVQKTSYIAGYNMSFRMVKEMSYLDKSILNKGIEDGAKSNPTCLFSDDERLQIKKEYSLLLLEKKENENAKKALSNLKDAKDFFSSNAKKKGIKILKNGLQYRIIKSGDGLIPKLDQAVAVYFKSRKLNGETLFIAEKRPSIWAVDDTLPGVKQALLQMPAGSIWQVFIPSNLAYGEHGVGEKIEPNMAVVYEIELLSVNSIKQ